MATYNILVFTCVSVWTVVTITHYCNLINTNIYIHAVINRLLRFDLLQAGNTQTIGTHTHAYISTSADVNTNIYVKALSYVF